MRLHHRLVLSSLAVTAAASAPRQHPEASDLFDWNAVTPSRDLRYHDCFRYFKCARLEVPLDWLNESDSRTAAIAIVRLPATVPDDDPTFGGSIFTNPGGPGGSGVDLVLSKGKLMQQLLIDKPGRRHYEIVSFDPRGVGHTTPNSDCLHANVLARNAWTFELRGSGGLASGLGPVNYALAMNEAFSRRCQESEHQWGEAMRFVNTPSVARDMVEMVDKIDELRKREAAERKSEEPARPELRRRDGHGGNDTNLPRLQYIGYSYGTILGNYFASLFPDRVGRLVLDSVANADDYANGPGWLTNLVDTDKIFGEFCEGCFKAGPADCALAREGESAEEAQKRFWTWVESLDEIPQPVLSPTGSIMVLKGSDVRDLIGTAFYNPILYFKELAVILNEALEGNTTRLVQSVVDFGEVPSIEDSCPRGNQPAPDPSKSETSSAVLCSDGDDITGKDASWWGKYVKRQIGLSKIFGNRWANIRFACSSWPFKANWSFKGPFKTLEADPKLSSGRPAAPLLFLSNRLDPVTPVSAARAMARGHPGSAVVVQDALGHGTFGRGPSECTHKIVADYFDYGTVPAQETFCEMACGPWDKDCNGYNQDVVIRDVRSSLRSVNIPQEPLRLRRFPLGLW